MPATRELRAAWTLRSFMEYQTPRVSFSIEIATVPCFHTGMERIRTILLCLLVAGPAQAASCDTSKAPTVPVVKGLPYETARTAIMASGWKAVVGHPHNEMSNNEVTFRDRGYAELQFCRLTDDSPCRFEYAAGPVALWVETTGDENAMLSTQAMVKVAKLGCVGDSAPD